MKITRIRLTQAPVYAASKAIFTRAGAPALISAKLLIGVFCLSVCSLWALPGSGAEVSTNEISDGVELVDGIQRSLEGPDVVITAGKDRTVYEYRQNGQLRIVKIIPKLGRPYYLVPADQTRGYGDLGQADMLLPQWVIIEF